MEIKGLIHKTVAKYTVDLDFDVSTPPDPKLGDYSTNAAFLLAKKERKNPGDVAADIKEKLEEDLKEIAEVSATANGFINFSLKPDFLRKQIEEITKDNKYGFNESLKGQTVMVEYTDPNPFKLFHIGHLMSNAIGEAIARLYQASGAKVIRVNYQGDIGLHVAKAIWGMQHESKIPSESDTLSDKVAFLGRTYAAGAKAYSKANPSAFEEIRKINIEIFKVVYQEDNSDIKDLYEKGKKWSLEYFEEVYRELGTKFDEYFFESKVSQKGRDIVAKNKNIFTESNGAYIFKGEDYGLHTRVFINSDGLPTYEAKELGLNKEKFNLYHPDLSIIVTGNEINEYFRVLLKVMELIMPEVAAKTRHVGHGMMRLASGKMSSRTGEVITAEELINQTVARLPESEDSAAREKIAIGAIKYSILKQSPGHDIIFDFEKSLSVKGDAGPYLQYTYARLKSILLKAGNLTTDFNPVRLAEASEIEVIKKILKFPEAIEEASQEPAPQNLALGIYQLCIAANQFYEQIRVLDDEDTGRRSARLKLISVTAEVIKRGLNLLGIETLEKI